MSLTLKILHGMSRSIQERVLEIKNSPAGDKALKRQQLRLFAELVLGTIQKLTRNKLDEHGNQRDCTAEEKEFIRKARIIEKDLHSLLSSVDADV
ncbi:hypothetical protein IOC09_000125 [Escherichia coli]|uniref:hypothetical protein n=1 Tax=Escherichia coli TaxID=562 RepID=UPI001365EEE5|nr:hypothetical protein [Escherichia coli]EGJ9164656.1 hypothetical protein [Escherichia coli]MDI0708826.1 hypothetical protein [Escherichia coli]